MDVQRQPPRYLRLDVHEPQVVGEVLAAVAHVGDRASVRRPARSETRLVRGVGLFRQLRRGATLDGNSEGRPGQPLVTKLEISEGGKKRIAYDYANLQRRLIEIKKTFPAEQSMIISADADVPYDIVIQTMDAARKSSDGKLLFPSVAFAAGVVG